MAKRFGWWWIPHWEEKKFRTAFPKKPTRIFVGSMSDICWWQPEWMERVLEKIRQYPQHTFYFLTKKPSTYQNISPSLYEIPENCWLGVTLVNNPAVEKEGGYMRTYKRCGYKTFASIEPMLGEMTSLCVKHYDWLIIGAMTGPGSEKYQPKRKWVEDIIKQAKKLAIPVYIKDNLIPVLGKSYVRIHQEKHF